MVMREGIVDLDFSGQTFDLSRHFGEMIPHDRQGPGPVVAGYRELVRDLRSNANRLLRKAGMHPAALDHLTAFISFEAVTSS
jgi:hypothetical protein